MTVKSQRVLKELTRNVSNQANLHAKNNDECYTSMHDIGAELGRWIELGKLEGKRIICPCDWDIMRDEDCFSITFDFEHGFLKQTVLNKVYRMPKVTYSLFDLVEDVGGVPVQKNVVVPENEVDDFLRDRIKCNFLRYLITEAKTCGIKSITASGYDPATNRGIKFQDIDYSKYDVCITNPPFSLMNEFVKTLLGEDYQQKKCDFIFLAPFMNRVAPNIGLPLMLNKLYLGYGRHLPLVFDNFINGGEKVKKTVACDWITSWDDAQKEVNANVRPTGMFYDDYKDDFQVYEKITMKDGTHPIRISGNMFPQDYEGWMLGPINLLDRSLNTDEYEWFGTNFKKFYNSTCPELNPCTHNLSDQMMNINGKQTFHGMFIRKKTKKEN